MRFLCTHIPVACCSPLRGSRACGVYPTLGGGSLNAPTAQSGEADCVADAMMPVQPAGLPSLGGVTRAGRGGSCELMIGCVGKADAEAIAMDESEMEDVRWVSREQLRAAVARSAATDLSANGGGARATIYPSISTSKSRSDPQIGATSNACSAAPP